jgi:hypothetical protein
MTAGAPDWAGGGVKGVVKGVVPPSRCALGCLGGLDVGEQCRGRGGEQFQQRPCVVVI